MQKALSLQDVSLICGATGSLAAVASALAEYVGWNSARPIITLGTVIAWWIALTWGRSLRLLVGPFVGVGLVLLAGEVVVEPFWEPVGHEWPKEYGPKISVKFLKLPIYETTSIRVAEIPNSIASLRLCLLFSGAVGGCIASLLVGRVLFGSSPSAKKDETLLDAAAGPV